MLEDACGRLIVYYFSFGDADLIVITEAPDNVSAASAVIAVARSSAVTDVRTTILMSYERVSRPSDIHERWVTRHQSRSR